MESFIHQSLIVNNFQGLEGQTVSFMSDEYIQ
jgi:hypothetical protein